MQVHPCKSSAPMCTSASMLASVLARALARTLAFGHTGSISAETATQPPVQRPGRTEEHRQGHKGPRPARVLSRGMSSSPCDDPVGSAAPCRADVTLAELLPAKGLLPDVLLADFQPAMPRPAMPQPADIQTGIAVAALATAVDALTSVVEALASVVVAPKPKSRGRRLSIEEHMHNDEIDTDLMWNQKEGRDPRDPRAVDCASQMYGGCLDDLRRGKNKYAVWYDCKICEMRVMYIRRFGASGRKRAAGPMAADVPESLVNAHLNTYQRRLDVQQFAKEGGPVELRPTRESPAARAPTSSSGSSAPGSSPLSDDDEIKGPADSSSEWFQVEIPTRELT